MGISSQKMPTIDLLPSDSNIGNLLILLFVILLCTARYEQLQAPMERKLHITAPDPHWDRPGIKTMGHNYPIVFNAIAGKFDYPAKKVTPKIRLHARLPGRGLDPPENGDVEHEKPNVRALQIL